MANKHLEGHGAPTIETVGYVGQQYTDLDTGDVYNCVGYTTHTIDDYKPTNPHEFVKFNTPTGKVRKYTWQLVPDNANNFGEVNEKFKKTKLSEFENDLFYRKEKVVGSFTMDDWKIDENGNAIITIAPKVKGLTPNNFELDCSASADSREISVSFVLNASNCGWEELESGKFVARSQTDDAPPFELRHGFTMDESDSIVDKDATEIIFFEIGSIPFDYFNIEFKIIDEKKIPIEYCDTSEIESELIGVIYGE